MKCQKIKKQLALFVGGDLAERETAELSSHLEHCKNCSAELEEFKLSSAWVEKIAQKDLPEPLPHDFSREISLQLAKETKTPRRYFRKPLSLLQMRPVSFIGGILLGLLIAAGIYYQFLRPNNISLEQLISEIQLLTQVENSELKWNPEHAVFKAFAGPQPIKQWDSPNLEGVYIILHKVDPANKPNTYIVDYCGQGRNLSAYRRYPWLNHRIKRLLSHTGSLENVYILTLVLPGSSELERRKIEKALIKSFDPYFNKGV